MKCCFDDEKNCPNDECVGKACSINPNFLRGNNVPMKIEFNTIILKSTPEFFIKGIQDKPPYSIREFEGKEIEEVLKFHAEFEEGQKKRIRIVGTHDPSLFFEREITDITWLSYFHGGKYGDAYIYGFAWEKKAVI